jgi:hypothetical protein
MECRRTLSRAFGRPKGTRQTVALVMIGTAKPARERA